MIGKSQPRDSPILLIFSNSMQVCIVTENVIKCIFSDYKLNEESDGNILILVQSLLWALFEFLNTHDGFSKTQIGHVTRSCSLFVYDYPNIFHFMK